MKIVTAEPALATWRHGRSLAYGERVSMSALVEIVRGQIGIPETDEPAEAEAKLHASVAALLETDDEAQWVERHLRPLVGLGGDVSGVERAEVFAARRRYLEAVATRQPLVLVFEDVHWADDNSLDFVDHVVEWASSVPLLVICTAQPELVERRPGWAGGKLNVATLSLPRLDDRETSQLLGLLLDAAEIDQDLITRTGGNPLYAHQYARMLSDSVDQAQLSLPESVQGIIAARLDLLPADEKAVLQAAAVVGNVFWLGSLIGSHIDIEEQLHALELKGFIRRAQQSSVAGEREYAFVHVLVRDVAYDQIPRVERANKHRAAAEWIESIGRPEERAEILAHHYSTALELMIATGKGDDDLARRTRQALLVAGDQASVFDAYPAAADFYARALSLVPEDDGARAQLLFSRAVALHRGGDDHRDDALEEARSALLASGDRERAAEANAMLAEVYWERGQRDTCFEQLERGLQLVVDATPSPAKGRVLSQVARYRLLAGDYEGAVRLGRAALKISRRLELDDAQANSLITLGTARFVTGELAGTEEIERGLGLALATNQLGAAYRGYVNLAAATHEIRQAQELLNAAEEISLKVGNAEGARYPRALRAADLFELGKWDEALAMADAFIAECDSGRPHYQEIGLRGIRATIHLACADHDAAIEDAQKAALLARRAQQPQNAGLASNAVLITRPAGVGAC